MTNEDSGWMRNPPIKQKKEIEKNNNKEQKTKGINREPDSEYKTRLP